MKKYIIIWMLILVTVLGGCAPAPEEDTPAGSGTSGDMSISCMSFNILAYNTGNTTYDEPEQRFEGIIPFILEQDADIVGIQEASRTKGFDWPEEIIKKTKSVYAARRIDEELEYGSKKMDIAAGLMILYRADRFEMLESGSSYYWEDYGRWYQWVKLKDKKCNKEIYVTNTHWSINPMMSDGVTRDIEQGEFLRESEAEELVTFWEETVGDAPLFATGDYNCGIHTEPHINYLQRSHFHNTCEEALSSDGESGVDFIYFNTKAMDIDEYMQLPREYTFKDGNKVTMSDHRAVISYATYK